MKHFCHIGRVLAAVLATTLAATPGIGRSQQDQQSPQHGTAIKPDAPGLARNHRLILKDGNYQMVRKYEVAGDRVRYLSLERNEWEELPYDLVDWDVDFTPPPSPTRMVKIRYRHVGPAPIPDWSGEEI